VNAVMNLQVLAPRSYLFTSALSLKDRRLQTYSLMFSRMTSFSVFVLETEHFGSTRCPTSQFSFLLEHLRSGRKYLTEKFCQVGARKNLNLLLHGMGQTRSAQRI
jgi:hypothetical protein